jgi:hypothetical protein
MIRSSRVPDLGRSSGEITHRRPDTIPPHKSGKARIATGALRAR